MRTTENHKEDEFLITRTLIRMLNSGDRKDYALMREQLADEVTIDFGGVRPAQILKADQLTDWASLAYRNLTTMHMGFNHEIQIRGDQAHSYSYGRALHKYTDESANPDFWNIYAQYSHELLKTTSGWRISRIQMTPMWQEGNPKLIDDAYQEALKLVS